MSKKTLTRNPFLVFFLVCFIHSIWAISIGWNHLILDDYSTRQTQTALAAFYLLQGGNWFAYEVPFMGAPWALPMEFPLYQWIVASIVSVFQTPWDQTGRFVGACFFYLSLIPSYIILGCFNVQKQYRWIFLSLFLASPLYLFWSRTFMIESTALFFGLGYFAAVCLYIRYQSLTTLIAAVGLGVLAAVVKVTTFAGFLFCAAILIIVRWQKLQPQARFNLKALSAIAAVLLLPCLAAISWTRFSDAQKLLNPLAAAWTSKGLFAWNFGTLSQRLSPTVWGTIVMRTAKEIWGSAALFVILLGVSIWIREYRKQVWLAVTAFLAVPFVFINLYFVHSYYAYAAGVFLIAAIGFLIVGLLQKGKGYKWLGYAVFTLLLVAQFRAFNSTWLPLMSQNRTFLQSTITALEKYTQPQDVLLLPYDAWSREIAYYSKRRMLSHSGNELLRDDQMKPALEQLSQQQARLGALLFCFPSANVPNLEARSRFAKTYGFRQQAVYSDANCAIHLPTASASAPKKS